MKRKFTFLIAVAFMLLTMMATTGMMWGQTRTDQTAFYGFESGDAGWTATTFVTNNTAITAHGGSKYGATNGTTADVKYNSIVATPLSLTCYYSKTTTNTNASSKFTIQVSSNGTTWTTVATGLGMDKVTKGTWYELSADLSSYSNVYVRVRYDGTTGVRALDDITLTYDDGQSPSTDPVISFTPASVTLDDVLVNNEASTTFTVSQSNLDAGITLSVNNGELSQYSIDKDADPTSIIWTYTPTAAGAISATVTATSGETSQTLEISGTAIAPVEGYDVDFEYATNMYPNWTFTNMTTQQNSDITAHGGTYYGTTGGKATASLTTSDKVENPGTLTCYVSKASNNTTSSTWYIQVSTDGSNWTNVNSQDATSMSKGTWVEFTADLSNYSNVYVRIYYNGSTAVRTIDDLTLTTAAPSNIFTVTYNANGATSGTVPVDETQYDSDNNTVTVLGNTGNLVKAGYIWAGWCMNAEGTGTVYGPDYTTTFEISANTTLYAKWDAKTITNLTYSGTPTATQYAGQAFNPAGLTVTATFNDESQEDVTSQVVWTLNPLTIETTSVTGTYMGLSVVVEGITVTYAPGTQNNPYTVAQAIAAIDTQGTINEAYATGIVCQVDSYNSTYKSITYWISDDGTTTTKLEVYSGKGIDGADFNSKDDIALGAEVVVKGKLKKYGEVYEFDYDNQLVSYVAPVVDVEAPTFSIHEGGYATAQTVAIACATEGATIYYTLDGSAPDNNSTQYLEAIAISETTTIKAIAYVGENASTVSTAAYYILSNENTYTVTQALEFETYPQNNIFVEGIVSTAPTSLLDGGLLTYYISVDGTETNRLQVYKGKNLGNIEFTAADNIQVGDVVTIFGNVKVYNNQKEFDQGNYLVTWERLETVATPTFTPAEGEYTEAQSVIIACTTDDATIYYKTAENEEWAVYSEAIDVDETTTIWAYAAKEGMNSSAVATATYTINIPVFTPSITVDPALVEATAEGGEGTLTVTYENITISEATDFGIQFYDSEENELNGDDEPDWVFVEVKAAEPSGYEVSYIIEDNAGEARTAYFKVYAMDNNTELVYSNLVTISQAAYVEPSQEVTDVLDLAFTGVSGTSYSDWSDKTGTSGAVYAGNSAGGNDAIQLRSKNSSGIVTTTSGGKVTKVEVTWNANTDEGRTLNIYGSDTAYESASDLYDDNAGTLIGTIVKGTSTELTVSDEYDYIGLRSANNAMYLDEINITWSTGPAVPSIAVADATVEVPAEGENNGVLALTYTNLTITDQGDFDIQYYDENGDELEKDDQPDWMEVSIQATAQEGYEVSYSVDPNEGEARTAYFKVYAMDGEDFVYSNLVTISQAAYVAPTATITVADATVNVDAEGVADATLAIAYENLTITENTDFDIQYYDENGDELEKDDQPDWMEASIQENSTQDGYEVSYSVVENDGEARTAYFKVFAMGSEDFVYSNLVTINQTAYVPPVVADNYELFSGDLEEGDYIIYYDGYAMKNTVSSNRLTYETVTPSENVISTNDATIVWHIASSGNYWTIYSADANAYAASTGTKNQAQMLGDGTDDKALWTVSGTSTYNFVNKYNTDNSVNAYLRNNGEYGFACYNSGTGGALSLYKKVDNTPAITITSPVEITADAHNDETIDVTYKNVDFEKTISIAFYTSDGETSATYDWITAANINDDHNVVYTTEANTGAARSAYFKVIGKTSESADVISNLVTITQAAYVAPVASITVDPATVNAAADGENGTLTVTYENITEIIAEVYFCDAEGEAASYDWITAEINNENNVEYLIVENDGEARTAYFKIYALDDNAEDVYSNLVTVTQAGDVPPVVTEDYELFSGNLVEGDYIIYYNGYAMKDDVDSNRLKYEEVTPDNDVIETGDATIVWHIAQNGDYWTIYSADAVAYAASTGTKNQATLYQGTPDNYDKALWTVSGTETYEFVNKYNSENNINANLRNNGTYGFACYASSTGGALSLYKKVDNTPSLSFNGPSANIGTYPTGEEITWGNIIVSQHNLTDSISLSAKKGTVTPTSIVADAEPTEVVWSYTPTTAGYTVDTITATSGTVEATFLIQFVAKTPHNINIASVENGTIAVVGGKTTEIEGENVDFTVTPDEGYVIDAITVMAGETPVDYIQGETFYRFQMPDSDVTISATFNALPTYTIKFYVNGEPDGELIIIQGYNTALPTESTYTPTGFSISGWAEEGSTIAVADPYTPTDDVNLYALFQLNNPPTASGNYVKVTEELTDWSGEYLIVYENDSLAFDGSLTKLDANNNTIEVTLTNNTIEATTATNASKFTIAAISEGYSIQSESEYFIGQTANENGLLSSTTTVYTNSISYDTVNHCVNVISSGGAYLRYNSDANRFRYYKSSSYSNQQAIQLYKKGAVSFNTVIVLNNTEPVQEWTEPIPDSTCVVVPENVVLTYTGPNPSVPEALVIQDGGQLIHENNVNATVQKTVAGASSWGKGVDGWYLIASPVNGASTSAVTIGQYDLFVYNEPTAYWWVASGHGINTFSHGQGFLYANAASVDLNFAGEMVGTETSVSVDLSYTGTLSGDVIGFNLVGNPFSRNLEDGDVMWGSETNIAYLTMNQARTDFVTVNIGERPIKPGEGFFFQADGEGQQLVFNPTTSKGGNGYIKIVAGNENGSDNAYINIANGNTIRKFNIDNGTKVYVMEDNGDDYAAARVEELAGSMLVNFKAAEDGEYTITVNAKNIEAHTMILFDDFTGETVDLLETPSYTFTASVNDLETRFKLIFDFNTYTGIGESYTNGNFAYQTGDEILVSGEGTLQVFDVMGRYVASFEVNGSKRISTSLFNAGVYIFKMTGMTQKIVVR